MVGAVAMVVGALVVRGRLDDKKVDAGQVYRLVCAADLDQVCADLDDAFPGKVDVTVESAGTTADRLRRLDGDPELDGWLVADPWPALVDEARRAGSLPPLFAATAPPLARSPLVIVAWKDRADALAPTCPTPGSIGWKCLGEASDQPWPTRGGQEAWGRVKVGHAESAADGIGLLVLGQATVEWFGRTDLSTFDLEDEGFQRWFSGLERPMPPSPRSPLDRMLQIGRAAYDFVGTTEAEAAKVDAAASRASLTKIYPSSMATADVVLTVTPGGRGDRLRDIVSGRARDRLTHSGWKAPGAAGLPAGNGLPDPGLLDALRAKAREVTGR
ncbi:MAG: hypothetical protein QOF60_2694 [Actinomycetota bacterium]|nr:hypothetical protein [Actinomycetota bacterium]MEA3077786.1 hypothetical protein [Actinomycetota bacterium]